MHLHLFTLLANLDSPPFDGSLPLRYFPTESPPRPCFPCLGADLATLDNRLALISDVNKKLASGALAKELDAAMTDMHRASAAVNRVKAKVPYFKKASPEVLAELEVAKIHDQAMREVLASKVQMRNTLEAHRRALTPIFSKAALDDIRQMYITRQKEYGGFMIDAWKFDMIWNTAFRVHSDDQGLIGMVIQALLGLFMNMTFSSVVTLFDFIARLPFYIREYEVYDVPAYDQAAKELRETTSALILKQAEGKDVAFELETPVLLSFESPSAGFFRSGLSGFLRGSVLYVFCLMAVILATILIIACIWATPFVILICCLFGVAAFDKVKKATKPSSPSSSSSSNTQGQQTTTVSSLRPHVD